MRQKLGLIVAVVASVLARTVYAAPCSTAVQHPATALSKSRSSAVRESGSLQEHHVSLQLRGITLQAALDSLISHAQLRLAYHSQTIASIRRRVSVTVSDVAPEDALRAILRGTGLTYRTTATGQFEIIRASTGADASAPGVPDDTTIRGTVMDAGTRAPLAGATVQLEGIAAAEVTDASGHYVFRNIGPGTYVMTVRRVGYTKATISVAIREGESITIDVPMTPAVNVLNQVVVTGTLVATEVKAVPTPVSVVRGQALEEDNIARVDEIFRTGVPGGVAWEQGVLGYTNSLTVRGASVISVGQNSMKIYVDGVEVSNDLYSMFDVNSIERIEVIRGPQASTMYGSGATGGVLQIFTKHGDPATQQTEVRGTVAAGTIERSVGGGVVAHQEYSAVMQGGRAGLGYSVGGSYRWEGEWAPEYYLRNPGVFGAITIQQGGLALDVSARYREQAFPSVNVPRLAQSGLSQYAAPRYEANRVQSQTYSIQMRYAITPIWEQWLVLGFDRVSHDDYSTRPRLTTPADTFLKVLEGSYQKPSLRYGTSVRLAGAGPLSGVLTAGADFYSLQQDGFLTSQAVAAGPYVVMASGSTPTVTRVRGHNAGYFVQGQVGVRDALFVTVGVRAERNGDFGAGFGTAWSPRAGLAYVEGIGAVTLKARASYGEALRPPPAGFGVGIPPYLVGNPSIAPERQRGGDAGIDLEFGHGGMLSLTAYSQDALDLIDYNIADSTTVPPLMQPVNVGRIRNTGLEIEGTLNAGAVRLRGQYTRMRSIVKELAPSYRGELRKGDRLLGVPEGTAALSVSVPMPDRTTITAGMSWIGRWINYDWLAFFGSEPYRGSMRAYWIRYPSVTKLNLAVTRPVGRHLVAFVDVHNLTNNRRFEADNLSVLPGRRTTLGVRFSY